MLDLSCHEMGSGTGLSYSLGVAVMPDISSVLVCVPA